MTVVIVGALASVAGVFLVTLTIQILRIEKVVLEIIETVDMRVSRMYEEPAK